MRIFTKAIQRTCNFSSIAKEPVGDVYTWTDGTPTKV